MAPQHGIDSKSFVESEYACLEPDLRNPGRAWIRAENCLFAAFGRKLPAQDYPIAELLAEMEAALLAACSELKLGCPDQDALRRAWDEWYEFMISAALWNANHETREAGCGRIVRLPGIDELRFAELFEPRTQSHIHELQNRLESRGVALITSTPNLVYIREMEADLLSSDFPAALESYSPESYRAVVNAYQKIVGRCAYANLGACIGVKSFSRPGRHLQIPHEASVLKTLGRYLGRRLEDRSAAEVRYYAISSFEPTAVDDETFRAVAPHCLIDESLPPERAVDRLFYVRTLADAAELLPQIAKR